MKYRYLIGIIPLFLFLNSVMATDVTTCTNITNSGYYQFTGNITATDGDCISGNYYSCIYINASDVTLDLKGYGLINGESCMYGIIILNYDTNDISITTDDLNILNGEIIGFTEASIRSQANLNNAQITYLNLYGIQGVSDGIELDQNGNKNIMIGENWFINDEYAFNGGCSQSCKFYDNEIRYSSKGVILWNYSFDVQRNLFGFSVMNETECFKNDYPVDTGIILYNVHNSTIKNNDFMANYPIKIQAISTNNNIRDNVFRPFYEFEPSVIFDASAVSNVFCNNQKIRVLPSWVYISGISTCYMSTQTVNAKGIVTDLDSNSILEKCTSNCNPNWFCDGTYRIYINGSCITTLNHTCEKGCQSGIYGSYCIGKETYPEITTTSINLVDKYNISYTEPVVNQTDLQESGLTFLIPFFTPMFLIITFELIFSGLISWIAKQPIAFPITIFFLTAILGTYGVFSLGITLLICIIASLSTALLYKSMVK